MFIHRTGSKNKQIQYIKEKNNNKLNYDRQFFLMTAPPLETPSLIVSQKRDAWTAPGSWGFGEWLGICDLCQVFLKIFHLH